MSRSPITTCAAGGDAATLMCSVDELGDGRNCRNLAVSSASTRIPVLPASPMEQQYHRHLRTRHSSGPTNHRTRCHSWWRTTRYTSGCRARFVNGVYIVAVNGDVGTRGGRWSDGASLSHALTPMLPPNGPSCMEADNHWLGGMYTAGSRHTGGC